jgi:predicted enzyme related to lactoylglutathione lyase
MADDASAHPPGTPVWVDLGSPDLAAGRAYYEQLFGWTSEVAAQPEAGGYTIFSLGGKRVAGAGPLIDGHPAWNTYIRSADAKGTAGAVRDAGGEVVVEPMQVMDQGTMAVFRDPTGAYFSVWQFAAHTGAELFNEPGSLCWNELATRDPAAARPFYAAVFGWDSKGEDREYVEWQLGGKSIAGMIEMNSKGIPEDVPPHWLAYFAVADCDATSARGQELGGTTRKPPTDIPGTGRFAVLGDPQGGVFGVLTGH